MLLPEVERTVVRELGRIDHVAACGKETACLSAAHTLDNHQVVADDDRAGVEQDVVVRTETEHIGWIIGAIVRAPEGANVCALGIRAARRIEASATDLAPEIIEFLYLLDDR